MPDIFIDTEDTPAESTPVVRPAPKTPAQRERLQGHSHNPLSSYSLYPDHVTFENRDKEEKVVLLLRRHQITNLSWMIVGAIMLLAPLVLSVFPILAFLPARFQFVAVLGWYMVSFAFILEKFVVWFYDIFLITTERVVDIDFSNLIYKEVTDASLDKIQDVTYTVGGVQRAVFNYGDVLIQTAGEMENLKFLAVPWPDKVANILQDLRMGEEKVNL